MKWGKLESPAWEALVGGLRFVSELEAWQVGDSLPGYNLGLLAGKKAAQLTTMLLKLKPRRGGGKQCNKNRIHVSELPASLPSVSW